MSEKMFTRLLRLYPSKFRKEYEGEALQLIRDRFRDETGFFKRIRLLWDLVADVFAGLPQAYRISCAATEAASFSPNVEGIPSFKLLDVEPIGRGSIFLGGSLSLSTIIVFGFLLSRSIAHLPVPGSNGRMSPIEAVVERLNRATPPDMITSGSDDSSGPASVGTDEQQPRSRPAANDSTAKGREPAFVPESSDVSGGQNQIVSFATQNPKEGSVYLTTQLPAGQVSAWAGVLTDAFGRPVHAAEIHLIGGHGELVSRTGEDGRFAFSEFPAGDYEVAVVLGGREVAYLKTLHLSAVSPPSELTVASGGRLLVSRSGKPR
jgi:hypothetical protein